jgi:predicted aldo/keto reductase-like oxidoreductase
MNSESLNRRDFLRTSAAFAGVALVAPMGVSESFAEPTKRTAADQVTLGKTGIKLSRLGLGTGSNNGREQTAAGKESFIKTIHYAYDHGITYIDTADSYQTFEWIADATKGLPREKLFIQSKVTPSHGDVLGMIDRHRKTLNTDYVDSLLVHCMTHGNWTDEWKRMMDDFSEARERKWIRAKGVSCHSLPALQKATESDWTEVHLVRVNPQGRYMDGPRAMWGGGETAVEPVMEQIKLMHAKGHGVIGMKICGNGEFQKTEDREKSIRFAMGCKEIDAIVIGFTSTQQIDEAIERVNRALA